MTIRHLKIFIAVADSGKMRRAAEQLYISQPSVSQAVKELEEHYNVRLFERLSQRLYITAAGKSLLSYARHIVSSFDTMEQAMLSADTMPLEIGGSVSVGTVLLGKYADKLEKAMPRVDLRVTVDNTSEIERLVLTGKLDVAVVEGIVKSDEIISHKICDDELVIVAGKNSPLYNMEKVDLCRLENQPLISREQGSADRNQFEQILHEHNISMEKKWSCTNTEAIKNAVINGSGVAILSKMLVETETAEGALKILNIDGLKVNRDIKLIYHKDKFISAQMQKFIEICKENR